jgi:hypothetical protein
MTIFSLRFFTTAPDVAEVLLIDRLAKALAEKRERRSISGAKATNIPTSGPIKPRPMARDARGCLRANQKETAGHAAEAIVRDVIVEG